MASTYSTNLKIELIGTGDQVGSWGTTTNTNLGTALEEAIVGYGAVQFTNDANLTLSLASSNASQTARKIFLYVTSTVTLTAQRDLIVPTNEKTFIVHNNTTGGQAIRVKTSAGTGIVVPTGKKMLLYVNGTNVIEQVDYITSLDVGALSIGALGSPLPIASGGTGASNAATARTNLGLGTMSTQNGNAVSITGGTITGITDLAVADGGTGASDAATARTNLGLGTIATQNASNVSITGGTITGSYGLTASNVSGTVAVGNGGTGATDAGTARSNLGLSSMATQASNSVSITGGSITGITDLAVADGGTGASSFSANNVLLGNGSSSFQTVAPGSNGNILTSNGSTWVSSAPATQFSWNVTYVSTSVSSGSAYTLPANCIGIFVWCTIPGSGNNGGVGRAQVRDASNSVLGTLFINGTNIGGGADGGSGMTDGAGSFLPMSSNANNVFFDVFNNAVSGTFTVQALITRA